MNIGPRIVDATSFSNTTIKDDVKLGDNIKNFKADCREKLAKSTTLNFCALQKQDGGVNVFSYLRNSIGLDFSTNRINSLMNKIDGANINSVKDMKKIQAKVDKEIKKSGDIIGKMKFDNVLDDAIVKIYQDKYSDIAVSLKDLVVANRNLRSEASESLTTKMHAIKMNVLNIKRAVKKEIPNIPEDAKIKKIRKYVNKTHVAEAINFKTLIDASAYINGKSATLKNKSI